MTDRQSPTLVPDLPRHYQENGMVSIWLSDDTTQALHERMLPDETPEATLRRRHRCPPGPQPDHSRTEPCSLGGYLLTVSDDMKTELIMRTGPGERTNDLIRRLIVLSDITLSGNFRVPTKEEAAWINQDRREGTDSDPRTRREGRK